MRVSDLSLQNTFVTNFWDNRARLQDIETKIVKQSKVNVPSDDPLAASKIMSFGNQLGNMETYEKNINAAFEIVENTIAPMGGVQTEIEKVLVDLTSVNSAIVDDHLDIFGQKVDLAINNLLDFANSQFGGRYLFAGDDNSEKPLDYDASGTKVEVKIPDIGKKYAVRISKNSVQNVNISGRELFQAVYDQRGNLDTTAAIGTTETRSSSIFNTDGTEYNFSYTYTKTAANTYDLSYEVTDTSGVSLQTGTMNNIVFDPVTQKVATIDGNKPEAVNINIPAEKINFLFDTSNLKEKPEAAKFTVNKNQETDIFNLLISIRDRLNNGERPNLQQVKMVQNFSTHVTNMLSEAGNISNKLTDAKVLMENQTLEVKKYMSIEKDVDMYKALIEMETSKHNLNMSYKVSSMILPQSLLDYL